MKRVVIAAVVALAPALIPAFAGAQDAKSGSSVVVQPATKLPRTHTPEPTSADISVKDLMTRLYLFADDSMLGREAGKIGNTKGTDYIAREAKRLGLQPAGENGGFFQTIPFGTLGPDSASTFSIGGAPQQFRAEWAASGSKSVSFTDLPVVYGGNLADSSSLIPLDQAKGKFVVLNLPGGALNFPAFRAMRRYAAAGVAGVGIFVDPRIVANITRPAEVMNDIPPGAAVLAPQVYLSAQNASRFFDAPLAQLKTGDVGKNASMDLRIKFTPAAYPARNVVAILPGSDPKLKGQYVAVGGHNDHVGFSMNPVDHDSVRIFNHIVRPGGAENQSARANVDQQTEINKQLADWRTAHPNTSRLDSIFNGADDDGTGSVSVLEIAEKLASLKGKDRPKRSVLFVWHVGEEKGLYGSTFFTDHPTVSRDSIVAQLNIDMVGRGDAWDMTGLAKDGQQIHGNDSYLQLVGSRRLSTELGDLAEQVNAQGKHGLSFDYSIDADGHPANIYCRSDHYAYARYGIPIIFFTTGGHSDYHQVTDEPEYIDYLHMSRVDQFIADVALHVANLDHRVVVDHHQKLDPLGPCRQ